MAHPSPHPSRPSLLPPGGAQDTPGWGALGSSCPSVAAGRCRPNVAGRRCDTCAPGFHGYPSCRPCDCHVAGTTPGVCDPVTGQCSCKVSRSQHPPQTLAPPGWLGTVGVEGGDPGKRPPGPVPPQENVEGSRCDQCRLGTFSLEADNPKGCTRCFCFGATERCRSSALARQEVRGCSRGGGQVAASPAC